MDFRPSPDELPGLANGKKKQRKAGLGNFYTFLLTVIIIWLVLKISDPEDIRTCMRYLEVYHMCMCTVRACVK